MTSTRRRRRRNRERCRCSLPQHTDSAAQIDPVRQDGCRFRLGKAPAKASAQIPIKPRPLHSVGELSLLIWQRLSCSDGLMGASVSTSAPYQADFCHGMSQHDSARIPAREGGMGMRAACHGQATTQRASWPCGHGPCSHEACTHRSGQVRSGLLLGRSPGP
jgi:hypothetical protein